MGSGLLIAHLPLQLLLFHLAAIRLLEKSLQINELKNMMQLSFFYVRVIHEKWPHCH